MANIISCILDSIQRAHTLHQRFGIEKAVLSNCLGSEQTEPSKDLQELFCKKFYSERDLIVNTEAVLDALTNFNQQTSGLV